MGFTNPVKPVNYDHLATEEQMVEVLAALAQLQETVDWLAAQFQ